jgi:Ca-activated chloride channel family protein
MLILLGGLPLLAWRLFARSDGGTIALGTASRALQLRPTWRQRSLWIVPTLQLLGLTLIVLALARPRAGLIQRPLTGEGVAIQLVIDRSGSMERDDFRLDGNWVSRLDAVKNVASQFVSEESMLGGRTDLVGLVTFARLAECTAPLTVDAEFVVARLDESTVARDFREDGTAIGDALGLAVASLNEYDNNRGEPNRPLKKVVVLLTDGEQNAGEFNPIEAADLAKAVDVTVHAIGIRSAGTNAASEAGIATLRHIAARTGGKCYEASDTEALSGIYNEIAQLEKADVGPVQYSDYREWAIETLPVGSHAVPPLTLLALFLLGTGTLLSRTIYRTIP